MLTRHDTRKDEAREAIRVQLRKEAMGHPGQVNVYPDQGVRDSPEDVRTFGVADSGSYLRQSWGSAQGQGNPRKRQRIPVLWRRQRGPRTELRVR